MKHTLLCSRHRRALVLPRVERIGTSRELDEAETQPAFPREGTVHHVLLGVQHARSASAPPARLRRQRSALQKSAGSRVLRTPGAPPGRWSGDLTLSLKDSHAQGDAEHLKCRGSLLHTATDNPELEKVPRCCLGLRWSQTFGFRPPEASLTGRVYLLELFQSRDSSCAKP